jgi:hypothetical protein
MDPYSFMIDLIFNIYMSLYHVIVSFFRFGEKLLKRFLNSLKLQFIGLHMLVFNSGKARIGMTASIVLRGSRVTNLSIIQHFIQYS